MPVGILAIQMMLLGSASLVSLVSGMTMGSWNSDTSNSLQSPIASIMDVYAPRYADT